MKTDVDEYVARIFFSVGANCEAGSFSYQNGPEDEPQVLTVPPGDMTGVSLDVGDKIVLEYSAPGVLSFVCVTNGAED